MNSAGMSQSSAITFTPLSDTSVIMQSRGNRPYEKDLSAPVAGKPFASAPIYEAASGPICQHFNFLGGLI